MFIGLILVLFFLVWVLSGIKVFGLNRFVDLQLYLSLLFKKINIPTVCSRFLTTCVRFISDLKSKLTLVSEQMFISAQRLDIALPYKGNLVKSHCNTVLSFQQTHDKTNSNIKRIEFKF